MITDIQKNIKKIREKIGLFFTKKILVFSLIMLLIGMTSFLFVFLINKYFGYIYVISKRDISSVFLKIPEEIIVALIEEFLFRVLIFIGLLQVYNNKTNALLISSIIFSFIHMSHNSSYIGHISYFLAGIMYGVSFLKCKSIIPPIILHFSWNFFQTIVFGFPMNYQVPIGYYELNIKESLFFNGGVAGIELSILGVLIRIFIIISIFLFFKNKSQLQFLQFNEK